MVVLKKARTCRRCWSFDGETVVGPATCDLWYPITTVYREHGKEGKPLKPCPKPLTGAEWREARKEAAAEAEED